MEDKQLEEQYGKPDSFLTTFDSTGHEHYFVRKSATDIGCNKCLNGWIDNGRLEITDGKLSLR